MADSSGLRSYFSTSGGDVPQDEIAVFLGGVVESYENSEDYRGKIEKDVLREGLDVDEINLEEDTLANLVIRHLRGDSLNSQHRLRMSPDGEALYQEIRDAATIEESGGSYQVELDFSYGFR